MTEIKKYGDTLAYKYGDNEEVYMNGIRISRMFVDTNNSGKVRILTMRKNWGFHTLIKAINSLFICGSMVYTFSHRDDFVNQVRHIFGGDSNGIEQTVDEEFPCEYLRENRKGNSVYRCNISEGQTGNDIAALFNEYDAQKMDDSYAFVSRANVVNAKGKTLKTLVAEEPVYAVAAHQ